MRTLWYTGPSGGEHVANPTAKQMTEFMRRGEDYWGPYSPLGELCWHEHPQQRTPSLGGLGTATQLQQLLFIRHPKRGWYFEYGTYNAPAKRWLVPLDPNATPDKYVKTWAYGEQLHFLGACFVSEAVAERIVADFLEDGEPSPAVSWVEFERVSPRLAPDEYRERRRRARGDA
jgi:hypothetical protein